MKQIIMGAVSPPEFIDGEVEHVSLPDTRDAFLGLSRTLIAPRVRQNAAMPLSLHKLNFESIMLDDEIRPTQYLSIQHCYSPSDLKAPGLHQPNQPKAIMDGTARVVFHQS